MRRFAIFHLVHISEFFLVFRYESAIAFQKYFEFPKTDVRIQGAKGKKEDVEEQAPLSLLIPIDAVKLLYPGTLSIKGNYPVVSEETPPLNAEAGGAAPKPKRQGSSDVFHYE